MQKETISQLSFLTGLVFIFIICFVIHLFINDELDTAYILEHFTLSLDSFVPENSEKLQYMFSVLLFPFIYFFSYKAYKKYLPKISEKLPRSLINTELVLCLILFSIMFYCAEKIVPTIVLNFYLISIIIFAGLYIIYKFSSDILRKRVFPAILAVFLLCNIIQIFKIQNISPYYIWIMDNFEAYFAPIVKTISGLAPGVDFHNLYGFYPYIYALFFNTSNANVFNISITNSILAVITMICLAVPFFIYVKNKYIGFFTYTVLCLYTFYWGNIIGEHAKPFPPAYYFQYMPHRVLFISIIIMLISIFPKIKSEKLKKIVKHTGFLICALALFWNFESGIAALAGWSIYHIYINFNLKNIVKICLESVFTGLLAFLGIFAATWLQSGQIINPLGMFFGQFVFYSKGFFMIKMHIFKQPFVPILLIYLVSLADGIKSLIEKKQTSKDAFKIAAAVIGFGAFTYFQGRSHYHVLIGSSYIAIIILSIFLQDWYNNLKKYKKLFERKNKPIFQYLYNINKIKFCIIFTLMAVLSINGMICLYTPHENKVSYAAENNIPIFAENPQDYDFFTLYSTLYNLHFQIPNKMNFPSTIDLFFKSDIDKAIDYLKKSDKKLVIDGHAIRLIKKYKPLDDFLNENYKVKYINEKTLIYEKKLRNENNHAKIYKLVNNIKEAAWK